MRKTLNVALATLSIAVIGCGGNPTGPKMPANSMNGLYTGSTSKTDIRLQVAYGEDPKCDTGNVAERILCGLFADNLSGIGSVTLRATGETQSFQFSGGQRIQVVLVFSQPAGVMVDTWLVGEASSDGKTITGTVSPRNGTPTSITFGDSTAITFVRSSGS